MTDTPSAFQTLNQYEHQPHHNGEWAHPTHPTMSANQYASIVQNTFELTTKERLTLKEKILTAETRAAQAWRNTQPAPMPQWDNHTSPHIHKPPTSQSAQREHRTQHAENTRTALLAAATFAPSTSKATAYDVKTYAASFLNWLTRQQENPK